jgi:hypothetical protein
MSGQPAAGSHDRAAGFCPGFPVTDMRSALAHYQQMGFEVVRYDDGAQWGWARWGRPSSTCT